MCTSDTLHNAQLAYNSTADPAMLSKVEEPTVRMTFLVNTSPFAGREGKFVTSRNIKERLERELERNLVRACHCASCGGGLPGSVICCRSPVARERCRSRHVGVDSRGVSNPLVGAH